MNDRDFFRALVRGFAVFEDVLELRIAETLAEPLDRLDRAPFAQKVNLAVGLGIVRPEQRPAFLALAKLRNQLAHAIREPEDITPEEVEALARKLDPERTLETFEPSPPSAEGWARVAIGAAYISVQVGAEVVRMTRESERAALRLERARRALPSPLIQALLREDADDSTVEADKE